VPKPVASPEGAAEVQGFAERYSVGKSEPEPRALAQRYGSALAELPLVVRLSLRLA
jgi:hypothetical protein